MSDYTDLLSVLPSTENIKTHSSSYSSPNNVTLNRSNYSGLEIYNPFTDIEKTDDIDISFESLSEYQLYKQNNNIPSSMGFNCNGVPPMTQKGIKLFLKTTDNKNFRLYTCAETDFCSPYYQNKFCNFVDNLKPDQKLVIYMGSTLMGNMPNITLGGMITSMLRSKGYITTHAVGRCGMTESCLWLFGQQTIISTYGLIQFTGVGNLLKQCSDYTHYFRIIFKRLRDKGLINEEQINELLTTSTSLTFINKHLEN